MSNMKIRRLANGNRSRISIRGLPSNDFSHIYSLITMQNLVVVSHTHIGRSQNFGDTGAPPIGTGVADS